jgi:hypothetical protein
MRIRIRIQQLKLMLIHADSDTDPDPKPCFKVTKSKIFPYEIHLKWILGQKHMYEGTKPFLKDKNKVY